MKKINLDEFMNNAEIHETAQEKLDEINGGCTITVFYCMGPKQMVIGRVQNKCSQYDYHCALAIQKAWETYAGTFTFN